MSENKSYQPISLDFLKKIKNPHIVGILLIGILLAAGYAAGQGAQISLSVQLQARLDALDAQIDILVNSSLSGMQKEASYIVSMVDTYCCMQNGTADREGRLEYFSTTASQVLSFATGNMTNGNLFVRSGNYSITRLTSNKTSTSLADRFPLTIANGKNINIIGEAGTVLKVGNGENAGLWYVGANTTVSLSNMELNGNYAGQTFNGLPTSSQDLYCIFSYGGRNTNVTLTNIYAHDAVTDNVALVGANGDGGYYSVQDLTTKHAQYDALIVSGGAQVYVDGYVANGYVELDDAATSLHLTNALMSSTAVSAPVISIVTGGSLYLSNFETSPGRIQDTSSAISYVNINNGRVNGDIILYNATGAISLINQTGNSNVDGLLLYGSQGLDVSHSSFLNNLYGIVLTSSSTRPCIDNIFSSITTYGNLNTAFKENDVNQDYNLLTDFNARNDGWFILTAGVHTHVSHSWNQTSWIADS